MSEYIEFSSLPPSEENQTGNLSYYFLAPLLNGLSYCADFLLYIWSLRDPDAWRTKRAPPPVLFLFLGRKESGKTTAIRRMCSSIAESPFRCTDDSEKKLEGRGWDIMRDCSPQFHQLPPDTFHKWNFEFAGTQLQFVEAPSFSSSSNVEANARNISAIYHYLERFSDTSIPTKVFITACLNESRFEGEYSEFSNLLKHLKYLGKSRLSDCSWSNLTLLLTHADRPDISDTVQYRIKAYVSQFKQILGVEPMYITTESFPISKDEILTWPKQQRNETEIKANQVQIEKIQVTFVHQEKIPLIDLYVSVPKELEVAMTSNSLNNINFFKDTSYISDFLPTEIIFEPRYHELGYIDSHELQTHCNFLYNQTYNLVEPKCQILLSDGSPVYASECFVGDRLLGHSGVGVITKLVRVEFKGIYVEESKGRELVNIADIFLVAAQGSSFRYLELPKDYNNFVYTEAQPQFLPKLESTNVSLVYIEVDGGTGTFVADGYVRKCSFSRNGNNKHSFSLSQN